MLFRDNGLYYSKGYAPVNVAMVTVTPMDKHGFFSFGLTNCCQMEMLRAADTIIFEVNKDMPYTYDAYNGHMHISEMTTCPPLRQPLPPRSTARSPATSSPTCGTASPCRSASAVCPTPWAPSSRTLT